MFLFNKRTRNVIKYMWGGFATIIILTMILAYSGFTKLTGTSSQTQEPIEIPAEVRAQLQAQQAGENINLGTTLEEQQVLDAINDGRINLNGTSTASSTPETASPAQEFRLEI